MDILTLEIADVVVLKPRRFADERGWFFESFNSTAFQQATGVNKSFVQDNHSHSTKGVLRGLHFQAPPKAQGKLVRVIRGSILDVAVDLRRSSATFRHYVSRELSEENREQLWIPEGFAHGFLTLTDTAQVLYKTTEHYAPETERTIIWNDPDIDIDWPTNVDLQLSQKDLDGTPLAAMREYFE